MRNRLFQIVAVCLAATTPAAAGVRTAFAYELSDTNGRLPRPWPRLSWDAANAELYVVNTGNGTVDVFNDAGMIVYSFIADSAIGAIVSVVPAGNESGDLFALSLKESSWLVSRCSFRGDVVESFPPPRLPASFAEFHPAVMRVAGGNLYLADLANLKILILGRDGAYAGSYDVNELFHFNNKRRAGNDMRGFNVSASGTMFGTVPGLFTAFVISSEGKATSFGQRGSAPGRFNIASGMAADEAGNLYVADTLRCVVMVFDKELTFLGEFGYRGDDEEGLIAPDEIAVGNGRVYVSQSRGGVKAFDVLVQ